jgi:hypothetical protein
MYRVINQYGNRDSPEYYYSRSQEFLVEIQTIYPWRQPFLLLELLEWTRRSPGITAKTVHSVDGVAGKQRLRRDGFSSECQLPATPNRVRLVCRAGLLVAEMRSV